jgi:hypothetical protein
MGVSWRGKSEVHVTCGRGSLTVGCFSLFLKQHSSLLHVHLSVHEPQIWLIQGVFL